MATYLLSTHTAPAGTGGPPPSDDEADATWQRLQEIEADMTGAGAWVFSGRLHDAEAATVVRTSDGAVVMTDGPFVEAKEHVAGFYIVETDLDTALRWAGEVSACIGKPIEVRPFAATAR